MFCKLFPFLFCCYAYPRKAMRSKAIAIKISTLAFALYFVCLRLFFAQKSIFHVFCFCVYAQYTNRKPCASKVMQSKFQCNANKISTLAFALYFVCLRLFFCTKTCFANCSLFCFVAMHTLEKQCVARQLQSKFQRNANKISTLAFALVLCMPEFVFGTNTCLHIFCFYVYAQYTNRKPCVSKAIAIKIST